MKTAIVAAPLAAAILSLLAACSSQVPPPTAPRPIRSVELSYGGERDVSKYFASVQARYQFDAAFRVGGKATERRVEVGQKVHKGDVLAVLDDADYRLAADAAQRQVEAADARLRQAESDWQRMQALEGDGSVSRSDEEHARSALDTARAGAKAQARALELANNQVDYAVLRASQDGVVTSVGFETGQVLAAGQPVVSIAGDGEPEIVVDVPEDDLESFRQSTFTAIVGSQPEKKFAVELRELSGQASAQTRTYHARLKPLEAMELPLGASATLIAQYIPSVVSTASIPAAALTQLNGKPAIWAARRTAGASAVGRVELVPVQLRGYRNDEVLVSGPKAGTIVVTAGIQKMAPGLLVALPAPSGAALASRSAP